MRLKSSVVIADDEPLARRTLRQYLLELGWRGPIHEAADGKTAIGLANKQRPDLLFLDIVMPGATGLEVLGRLEYEPKVILTTAYDQFAVTAFELGALDYVLKPFGRERLAQAIQRATSSSGGLAHAVLSRANEALQKTSTLSSVFVRDGSRIVPVPLASLERAQGADDYVTLYTVTKEYLVSIRLSDLERRLAGANFLRIHRSHLINLEYVRSIEPYDAARVLVAMESGTRIVASRPGSRLLRGLVL